MNIVKGHCYFVKDLETLCKIFRCTKCEVAFNKASNLRWIVLLNHGLSVREREWKASFPLLKKYFMGPEPVFLSRHLSGLRARRTVSTFITPFVAMVVRDSSKWGKEIRVDGYEPISGTVYQYHGCYWHGCPCVRGGDQVILVKTLEVDAEIVEKHPMVVVWEHEVPNPPKVQFPTLFHPYPGFIVYDFEARMRKKVGEQKTQFYEVSSEHIPISFAISDSVANKPVYLVDEDPKGRFFKRVLT